MTEPTKPKRNKFPDIQIGEVFTRLTVTSNQIINEGGYKVRECICACGTPKTVMEIHLKSQNTKSCGCLAREGIKVRGENRKPRKKQQNSMPCLKCGAPCLHSSSHCGNCRRVSCKRCAKPFMAGIIGETHCGHCKKAKSRPSRGDW